MANIAPTFLFLETAFTHMGAGFRRKEKPKALNSACRILNFCGNETWMWWKPGLSLYSSTSKRFSTAKTLCLTKSLILCYIFRLAIASKGTKEGIGRLLGTLAACEQRPGGENLGIIIFMPLTAVLVCCYCCWECSKSVVNIVISFIVWICRDILDYRWLLLDPLYNSTDFAIFNIGCCTPRTAKLYELITMIIFLPGSWQRSYTLNAFLQISLYIY